MKKHILAVILGGLTGAVLYQSTFKEEPIVAFISQSQVLPISGTIKNFQVRIASEGEADWKHIELLKNGEVIPNSPNCIIVKANGCSDLTNTIEVVAGDTFSIKETPIDFIPRRIYWAVHFIPKGENTDKTTMLTNSFTACDMHKELCMRDPK